MRFTCHGSARAAFATLVMAGGLIAASTPAAAQDDTARLRKLEAEVKALQRQVFPGGDGKYFAPEVVTPTPGVTVTQQPIGTPAESPLTDVLNRLTSIESQLSQLTARSEVAENSLSQLQTRVAALEARASAPPPPPEADAQPTGAIPIPRDDTPKATERPARKVAAKSITVIKPDTGNDGDDQYSYGFRLWEAGQFAQAQKELKLYVDRYPSDPKISYGRNLLGRSYLDDGQPRAAAPFFLENYQKDPAGARAPDSLLYLAESMIALKDNTRACRALAEFGDKYSALSSGRLQDQYARDRKQAGCK